MSKADDEFQRVVMEGLVPKVAGSAVCISIVPADKELWVDAKFCVELGVMIMLDKPILALVHPDSHVPEKLRLVADKIVAIDISTPEGRAAVSREVHAFAESVSE